MVYFSIIMVVYFSIIIYRKRKTRIIKDDVKTPKTPVFIGVSRDFAIFEENTRFVVVF